MYPQWAIKTKLNFPGKLEDMSFEHIPSASRPTSPDAQLAQLREEEKNEPEISEAEIERYKKYIKNDIKEENIETMSKEHLEKIKYGTNFQLSEYYEDICSQEAV